MPFTTYLDEKLVTHAFGGPIWTPPSTLYVALSTSAPTQQQGSNNWNFTPATGGGYAPVALAYNTTNFVPTAAEPGIGYQVTIGVTVAFPESTGPVSGGATLGWFGIFDAVGGNLLDYGTLNPAVSAIGPGYVIEFPAGALVTDLT